MASSEFSVAVSQGSRNHETWTVSVSHGYRNHKTWTDDTITDNSLRGCSERYDSGQSFDESNPGLSLWRLFQFEFWSTGPPLRKQLCDVGGIFLPVKLEVALLSVFMFGNVWKRSYSSNINGPIHSDSENASEKLMITGRAMGWWLPLLHWIQADQDRQADFQINEAKTKGTAMHKSSDDIEEEMEQVPAKRSKLVRGRLTREKAKILRKNLPANSRRRNIMYHSAIASRLASPDTEVHT